VYSPTQHKFDFDQYCQTNSVDFLIDANSEYSHTKSLSNYKGFHVIRDPRDICVSAYYSHLYSHPDKNWPELVDIRKKLLLLSKTEGLKFEMEFLAPQFRAMYNWRYGELDQILEIKMEKLVEEPVSSFVEIFTFLELLMDENNMGNNRINEQTLALIIGNNRFTKKTGGRQRGQEDIYHHYRKGLVGDWKNHFDYYLLEIFNNKYIDLLKKLKYDVTT